MKCNIARDLLSNYIDDLTSEETNEEIKKHLDDCKDCSTIYEKMLAVTSRELPPEDRNIDFLKKLKTKIIKKNIIIFLSTCIMLLTGFFIFANTYEIPLPFDAYRMSVELIPTAAVVGEDGKISWKELKSAISSGAVPDSYGNVINVLYRNYQGINGISENSIGRTIHRNDKDVRVVYYCYSKTLWNSLFSDPDLTEYSEGGRSTGTDMYGDNFESADYKPQMTEVYYLPIRDIYKIDNLSDEKYDMLREKSELIWSGVI